MLTWHDHDLWPLADEEVEAYVARVVKALTPEQLRDCLERDVAYAHKIKTKITTLIALETKGDDRDNSHSTNKVRLGKQWEAKAGGTYRYIMVFDNNAINGAETLAGALNKLKQL